MMDFSTILFVTRSQLLRSGREKSLRMRGTDIIVHSKRGNDMILVIKNQIYQLRQAHCLVLPQCSFRILVIESGIEVSGWTDRFLV